MLSLCDSFPGVFIRCHLGTSGPFGRTVQSMIKEQRDRYGAVSPSVVLGPAAATPPAGL